MAQHQFRVDQFGKYPFLTLKKINEDDPRRPDIVLSGDELEDYEQTVTKFAEWQRRLADAE